jgi:chromate transporter
LALDVPILWSVNLSALALTLAAILAVFKFRLGMLTVLAGAAAAGLLYHLMLGSSP